MIRDNLESSLAENIDLIQDFSMCNSNVKLDPNSFCAVRRSNDLSNYIINYPFYSNVDLGVLVIKKLTLKMSEVIEKYKAHESEGIRSIDVFSYSFYFDKSATFSGVNLTVQTQYAHIIGNKTVNLKGKDGEEFKDEKAKDGVQDGSNGEDGKPGNPGKAGGNFYLDFKNGTATGKLLIDVSGGNGGKGQDGGDGKDGEDGKEGNYDLVNDRYKGCLVSRRKMGKNDKNGIEKVTHFLRSAGTLNGQFLETYRSEGTPGQNGGDAGRPGIGGKGACPGTAIVKSYIDNSFLNFDKIVRSGEDGENGKAGKVGKGGKYGKSWQGRYVNELFMPCLREDAKDISETSRSGDVVEESFAKVSTNYLG